jgi:intracellular sulfur oxidation DsrE/DsrF family protein
VKHNEDFSDEILNAFIDDELDHAERSQILSTLRNDERLTQRICDLQKVRGLVQLAYSDATFPANSPANTNKYNLISQHRFVAGILLLLGVFIGWFANQSYYSDFDTLDLSEKTLDFPVHNQNETWHVMLHVSNNDPQRFDVLLSETEYLLESHKQKQQPIEIELLANGKGINLLKEATTEQAKKLIQLTSKYNNLTLSACGKTLERLQKDTGSKLVLLPNTKVVRSAIYEVTRRQKEGWSYIRI